MSGNEGVISLSDKDMGTMQGKDTNLTEASLEVASIQYSMKTNPLDHGYDRRVAQDFMSGAKFILENTERGWKESFEKIFGSQPHPDQEKLLKEYRRSGALTQINTTMWYKKELDQQMFDNKNNPTISKKVSEKIKQIKQQNKTLTKRCRELEDELNTAKEALDKIKG